MTRDIVLIDINMPVMNGLAAAREIRRILPKTKIVFLTVHDTPALLHGIVSLETYKIPPVALLADRIAN